MSATEHSCCERSPKQTLNSLDEVLTKLEALANPMLDIIDLPLLEAYNHVLAEDITASINVPPADNSAVDGYAINTEDYQANQPFQISQRIPAGTQPEALLAGTVARIFTGASIPDGANAVIMQEDAIHTGDKSTVSFEISLKANQNIRPLGQDIQSGDVILTAGQLLSPQRIGLLASVGIAQVKVLRPLKVAILSTGDELVEPGHALSGTSQIYNSNRYMLTAMLKSLDFEVLDFGVIKDNKEETEEALKQACLAADVTITTGGASVGEEDYIQSSIEALGSIDFWKVAIKPGKPFMYGEIDGTPILGLPGNPGAVFVTFSVMARHFLLLKQGMTNVRYQSAQHPLGFNIKKAGIRREFLRVQLNESGELIQHPNQSSGMLSSASWADGLAVIQEHTQPKAGELIDFIPFQAIFNRYE